MKQIYKILLFLALLFNANALSAKINFGSDVYIKTSLPPLTATISGGTTVCQNATGVLVTFTGSGGTAPYTFTYTVTGVTGNQTITTTGTNSVVTLAVPTGTAGTFTYNLVSVHDSTIPIFEQTLSGQSTVIKIITVGITNPLTLVACLTNSSQTNAQVGLVLALPTPASLIQTITINWGDGSAIQNIPSSDWSNPIFYTYPLGAYTVTITSTTSLGCNTIKTYTAFIGSSPQAATLSLFANQATGCSPHTTQFTFGLPVSNSDGTNYRICFGDNITNCIDYIDGTQIPSSWIFSGSTSQFNYYTITHIYTATSCNNSVNLNGITYNNVFLPSVITTNPCTAPQPQAGSLISVGTTPTASFTPNPIPKVCVNIPFQPTNTSDFGGTIDPITYSCTSTSPFYWTVSPATTGLWTATGLGSNNGAPNNELFWTTGSMTPTIIFNQPGNYTITLFVKNSCGLSSISHSLCVEPPLIPLFTINTNSGCIPLSVTTNNTTSPINQCSTPTYTWSVTYASGNCGNTSAFTYTGGTSSSSTSPSFSFTEAGNYTIKLTATNSCSPAQTSTQIVTVKKPPTVSLSNISNLCQSSVLIPVSSIASCTNTTPTYLWSFPSGTPSSATTATPPSVSYATTGNYTISLAVTNECGTTTATSNSFIVSSSPIVQNEVTTICSGTAFSVTPSTTIVGNNIPVGTTYSWNTPIVTGGITGGFSGANQTSIGGTLINSTSLPQTATYTVTPKLGICLGITFTVVVTVNPAPILTTQPASSTVCQGGAPTVLSVVLNNTSGSPSYQWYSNTVNNSTTGTAISGETNTTYNPPSSTIGTTYYYCVITLASGGCSTIKSSIATVIIAALATITQPVPTQNLCVGTTIASPLSVTASGGAGTPTYQWYSNTTNSNTGGTLISGVANSNYTPPVFNTAGTFYYYAVVNYANGCGNLTSNIAEIVIFNDPTIATQPITTQTLCQTATPTNLEVILNGSATFSYQWYSNNSNNTTSGTIISGATNSTYTPPTTTVGTKYYYCIITQNGISGCSVTSTTSTVIITVSPNFTSQPLSSTICLGQTPTQLSVSYNSGSGTANYQWYSNTSNATSGGTSIALANSSSYTPPATTIGNVYYYCIITFPSLSGGCSIITSNSAQVTINPKPTISNQTSTICSSATFTVTPANSSTDIVPTGTTYTWSTPIINPIGSIIGAIGETTPQTSISQTLINTITTPATATYMVTPTTGSCAGATFTITVTVNPSTNPNAIKSDVTCFGINNGSITTNIIGGIPFLSGAPYLISWTGPGAFTSSSPNISNLIPGVYNLSITDAGGCPISNNYTIAEPTDIVITTDINNNITCFGANNGAIAISVSGGTGAYSYSWTQNTLLYSTTDDINNLAPATYVVSVSDVNNCGPKTTTFTITEPPFLSVSLVSQTNVDCYGFATGAITVNTTGGTPIQTSPGVFDYTYSWTGPNGFTNSNQNISNLFAGTYDLTVTDSLGCTKNLPVTITESPEIIINAITTPIICYGDNNATITVTLSGGNSPYQVQWSNLAVGLFQNNLAPGNYTITVTDAIGCIKVATINIPSPPIFTVNPVVTNISCFGAHDGNIVLNFVGGIAPVNLVWSDGSPAGITRNNLGPGTYSVIITDSKPCTISRTFTILEPQPLVLSANTTNALDCNNANTGAINLLVSGGTPPFNYSWNNGTTIEDLINIPAGNYAITVTDARGCTKTAQYSITRPNPLTLSVNTTTNANCNTHIVTQFFTAQPTGGVPPYLLNWSSGTVTGANNEFMTTTQNGLVTLTATDAIGCTTNYSLNVAIPILGNPTFGTSSIGLTNYGIYAILDPIQFTSVIMGDYTAVVWDFGDGTFSNELNPIHTYLIPNDYYFVKLTVTYPFGCVYVSNVALNVEKGYLMVVPTAFTPYNLDGINDTFRPVTKGLKNVHLDVYDTWGSLIYSEVGDTIVGWNGKVKGISSENGNYYAKVSGETFYGTIINENHTFVLIK